MAIVIEIGKMPEEPFNAALGFWLPPSTPYGNFTLKLFRIFERLDEANRRLQESSRFWSLAVAENIHVNAFQRHSLATEEAIYMMRRAADEIISLIWCLSECEKSKEYPDRITIDCIGSALSQDSKERHEIFTNHEGILVKLNDISNAHKHSFIQSDINLIGRDEPVVYALALTRNRLDRQAQFHSVSLSSIATAYTEFFRESLEWMRGYSARNREHAEDAKPDNVPSL